MTARAGSRVVVRLRLLQPQDRAPGLPQDTASLPYEALVRGTLLRPSPVGEWARIRTVTGRTVEGWLEEVEPADSHTFGRPHAALVAADVAISDLMRSLHE